MNKLETWIIIWRSVASQQSFFCLFFSFSNLIRAPLWSPSNILELKKETTSTITSYWTGGEYLVNKAKDSHIYPSSQGSSFLFDIILKYFSFSQMFFFSSHAYWLICVHLKKIVRKGLTLYSVPQTHDQAGLQHMWYRLPRTMDT
jgi:hypothetical protein